MKILLNLSELGQLASRAPIPLECEKCHQTFYKPKNQVLSTLKGGYKKNGNRFCSISCSNQNNRKDIITNCFYCKKEIIRMPSKILERNFCSCSCSAKYNGDLHRKPEHLKCHHFRKVKKIVNKKETIIRIPRKEFIPAVRVTKNCSFCNNEIIRTESRIKKSKTQTFFCNKSCKTKYLHKFQIVHKPRSRAEKYLVELIKRDFPNINILENYRNLLSNNLEIDIYLPDYKLCIELNGPVHYFPIWGQEKLDIVHNKDIQKQIEISKLQLNLMVIDISKLNSNQKTKQFLDEYFISHIKPILDSKMAPAPSIEEG